MRHSQSTWWTTLGQSTWANTLANLLKLSGTDAVAPQTLAQCLLAASALKAALSTVARRIANVGRETLRLALDSDLPSPDALEFRFAAAFRQRMPKAFQRKPIAVAIDIHQRPYYGDRKATPGVTGGKIKNGTRWFWAYATVVSLTPGHRHTLGLTRVGPKERSVAVVERLLQQLNWASVQVKYVLLDRGFYAAEVMKSLNKRSMPFIIPVPRRGKVVEKLFRSRSSGWHEHTVRCKRLRSESVDVRVCVCCVGEGKRPLVFACSEQRQSVPEVVLSYWRRFGIESSYRQLGESLARTTSRSESHRLLLGGVSLLIREWWVDNPGVSLRQIGWNLIITVTPTHHTPGTQTTNMTTLKLSDCRGKY